MPSLKQPDSQPTPTPATTTKKRGPILDYERAAIEAAFCRMAAKAGCRVLQYALRPGEQVSGQGAHIRHIVTVELPRVGQVVFGFAQGQSDLLTGLPRTGAATVRIEDLTEQDFELLVRGALACFPGRLEESGRIPWNGSDANAATHAARLDQI